MSFAKPRAQRAAAAAERRRRAVGEIAWRHGQGRGLEGEREQERSVGRGTRAEAVTEEQGAQAQSLFARLCNETLSSCPADATLSSEIRHA